MKFLFNLSLLTLMFFISSSCAKPELDQSKGSGDSVKISGNLLQCLDIDFASTSKQSSKTEVKLVVSKVESIGHCGCKSKFFRYQVLLTLNGRQGQIASARLVEPARAPEVVVVSFDTDAQNEVLINFSCSED